MFREYLIQRSVAALERSAARRRQAIREGRLSDYGRSVREALTRIRDGLAALAWLRARPEVDPARILVGGHGGGALAALHVAAAAADLEGVFARDFPASFAALVRAPDYTWSQDLFFPRVLRHYDLPGLAASLRVPVLLVNPLDARKQPLAEARARLLYGGATAQADVALHAAVDESGVCEALVEWVRKLR